MLRVIGAISDLIESESKWHEHEHSREPCQFFVLEGPGGK